MKIKKTSVEAAELIKYNANAYGNRTTDCVKRSISLAFDTPYTDVAKKLNAKMKELRKDTWMIRSVYDHVIHDLAGGAQVTYTKVPQDERVKLETFVDEQIDPSLVYLVQTGKRNSNSDHLVCIREGKVFDSWDSRDQWVISYYTIGGFASKQFTDIKDHIEDIAVYTVKDLVNNEVIKYMQKKKWDYYPIDLEVWTANFQITAAVALCLKANDLIDKKRYYDFKVTLALTPTMTTDEAKEYVAKTGKQRVYDKMWAINEQEKKLIEEYQMIKNLKDSGKESTNFNRGFMTNEESRFFYSLPGWVRPLVRRLDIEEPGVYSDSYTVVLRPLPEDDAHQDRIRFEAYTAAAMKDMLQRYKDKLEVPHEDYDPYEEY